MMEFIELVKSVIYGMLFNSLKIYVWIVALLNMMDTWIINFVWIGKIDTKKLVILSWDKVCTPIISGGLSLRKIKSICYRGDKAITYVISSSILHGLKTYLDLIHKNKKIGKGRRIPFRYDKWLGYMTYCIYDLQ